MGSGGVTNHGTNIIEVRKLEPNGDPETKIYRTNNGKIVQCRWYDKNGKAIRNRDYSHGGKNVEFPHDHVWIWDGKHGVRGREHLQPDYEDFN